MKRAGREGSETKDWVATDMKTRGKADQSTENVSSWVKKLGFALDKEREHAYDDIAEDMEKTARPGITRRIGLQTGNVAT
jgi:RecG-like helicase